MKRLHTLLASLVTATIVSGCSSAPQLTKDAPTVYLNESFGFTVEGYRYDQSEIPCKIDTSLVDNLVKRAAKQNINMEVVSSPEKIHDSDVPVLAIDIDGLILGKEKERRFGKDTYSDLPSITLTTAYIKKRPERDVSTHEHACAISRLNEFTPSTNVMDLGYTTTVCSAARKCTIELSNEILDWLAPQI